VVRADLLEAQDAPDLAGAETVQRWTSSGTYDVVGLALNGMQPAQVAFARGVKVMGDAELFSTSGSSTRSSSSRSRS
jgi:hypothetical protein